MKNGPGLILLAALIAAPAGAATMSVEGAVSPAWVERAGERSGLPWRRA